jgi:PAS domain-containing protein
LVGTFRLNDPIVTRVDFSGCNMPAMDLSGYESESKRALEAQLRATLDVIPACTWYADPSGALTFLNKRHADYLGLPKDHPLRFGIATGAAWDSHILLLHPDDHEEALEFGQPVYVQVRPEKCLFEFGTRQESIAGSSLVPNPSGRAMELSCIG